MARAERYLYNFINTRETLEAVKARYNELSPQFKAALQDFLQINFKIFLDNDGKKLVERFKEEKARCLKEKRVLYVASNDWFSGIKGNPNDELHISRIKEFIILVNVYVNDEIPQQTPLEVIKQHIIAYCTGN